MLPLFNLQLTNLAIFDTGLNTAELLPQEAAEPSAAFAELLRLGVEASERQLPVVGTALPRAGNPLPLPGLPAIEAAAAEPQNEASLPVLQALHNELLPIAPVGPAAGEGSLREAPGAAPAAGAGTAVVEPAASQASLGARLTRLQSRHAAEAGHTGSCDR